MNVEARCKVKVGAGRRRCGGRSPVGPCGGTMGGGRGFPGPKSHRLTQVWLRPSRYTE